MSLKHLEKIEQYAQIILELGINLTKGDKLLINTNYASYEFARLLAVKAYEKGASYVYIDVHDTYLTKAKIQCASWEDLDYLPPYLKAQMEGMIHERWARIRIDNTSEIGTLVGLDAQKQMHYEKSWSKASLPFHQAIMSNKVAWCVVCFPDPYWAASLLGMKADQDAQTKLWQLMMPLLRLDENEPLKAWKEHINKLRQRCSLLNKLKIQTLHFKDEQKGTEFRLDLCEQAVWLGGDEETQFGLPFLANIPTEEVFTAPHLAKAEGRVFVTRPVKIMETQLEGIWFELKDGKATAWGAQKHKELLDKLFSMDEGATRLGEVALVDKNSPICQSGQIFSNILFDENASCHIAFGAAYPTCSLGAEVLEKQEQRERGLNSSLIHKDFMIGSSFLSVQARDAQGKWHDLMKDGEFLI